MSNEFDPANDNNFLPGGAFDPAASATLAEENLVSFDSIFAEDGAPDLSTPGLESPLAPETDWASMITQETAASSTLATADDFAITQAANTDAFAMQEDAIANQSQASQDASENFIDYLSDTPTVPDTSTTDDATAST